MNAAAPAGVLKTVEFQHPYFRTNADGYFRLDDTNRRPVYVVSLGDQAGIVSFYSIRQELMAGEHGADQAMLDAVAAALNYVAEIRIGDDLPSEIVTGEASWQPAPHHAKLASGRVVASLVKWHELHSDPIARPHQLQRFLSAKVDRAKISAALRALDDAVGAELGGMLALNPILKEMVGKLAYIEALRESIERVRRIGDILETVRRIGGGQANDTHEVAAVLRVFNHMMRSFDDQLCSIDTRLHDMPAAVGDTAALYEHMRGVRNRLRCQLVAWEDQLDIWQGVDRNQIKLTEVAPKVGALYRFLAPQYSPVDEWERRESYHKSLPTLRRGGDGDAAHRSDILAPAADG